jgi:galactose mutarotase-like enzyme
METTEQGGEFLTLESDQLRVSIAPRLGGKIASLGLKPGGEELLQGPLQPYALRTGYMPFDASDASGWDECLPSVSACEVETAAGKVRVPDHGDFWQVEWQVVAQDESAVTIAAEGSSLPLRFSKVILLEENRLHVGYKVQNVGRHEVEYIWSAHPLFAVNAGDRIVLPDPVKEVVVEGSAGERLGAKGTKHAWPQTTLRNHKACDLSIVGRPEDGVGDKLFTAAPAEGWCAIERRQLHRRVELQFDPRVSTYLGLWICYGGWPEGHANRQYCVALEPCNAMGDSLAEAQKEGRTARLAAGEGHAWQLVLKVDGIQ